MATELEKPRVTEIQVRMDCNGCVQKIKKALHGIHGIYDLYIDFPQQKITIVGSADPEKIVKAIKKTRKSAIICSHTEQADPPTQPPVEPAPADQGEAAQAPECANSPPTEAPPSESAPATEPPKEPPKSPPPQENQPADEKRTPEGAADNTKSQTAQPSKPRDVEEVHVIYHYPPDYGYRYNYGQGMSSHDPPRDYGYRYNYGQNMSNEPQNMSNEPPLRDHGYARYNYGQTMSHETTPRDHGYTRYNYGQATSHETSRDQCYNRYNYTQSMSHELPRDHVAYRYNYDQNMSHEQPPRDFGYRSNQARPVGPEFRQEPSPPPPPPPPPSQPPIYATHNYNSYRASPYVTGYEYIRPPPQYTHYSRLDHYSEDYHNGNNNNGTIASVFSDENPNACTIA